MKNISIAIALFILSISLAFAGQRMQIEDEKGNILGTNSSNPIHVNCISGCGGSGSGVTFTDGVHTVSSATQLTVTGGTIGGTSPNGTLLITGGTNYWTLTGNNLYPTTIANNVGIGSSNPSSALDVGSGKVTAGTYTYPANGNTTVNGSTLTLGLNTANFEGGNDSIGGSSSALLLSDGNQGPFAGGFAQLRWDDTTGYIGLGDINETGLTADLDTVRVFQNSPGNGFLFGNADLTNSTLYFGINGEAFSVALPNKYAHNMSIFAEDNDVSAFNGNKGGNLYIGSGFGTSGYGNVGIGTSGGNVGIGSVSPGQRLDVQGTIRSTGYIAGAAGITLGGVTNTIWPAGTSQWTTINTNDVYLASNGNVGIGTNITTGGKLIAFGGNVGVSTINPQAFLEVDGDRSQVNAFIVRYVGSSFNFMKIYSPSHDFGFGSGTAVYELPDSNHSLTQQAAGAGWTWHDTDPFMLQGSNIQFYSGAGVGSPGTERMRITGANVGINQTAPSDTLAVNGNASVGSYSTTAGPSNGLIVSGNVGIGTSIASNGQLLVMGGNVGIGTWIPNATLAVSGTASFGSTNAMTVASNGGVTLKNNLNLSNILGSSSDLRLINSATHKIIFQRSDQATDIMDLIDSGNVGIGSVNPNAELDVEGTLYPTVFYGHGTNFNVGIGSASPGQALDVNGTVRMTGFNLSNTPTNNYVLTSDASGNGTWQPATGGSGTNYWNLGIGNVGINTTTNNVGIGTFAVPRQLTISNTAATSTGIELTDHGTGGRSWSFFSTNNGSSLGGGKFGIFDDGTSKSVLIADSGDNVGINTVTPSAMFEVGNQKLDVLAGGNVGIGTTIPGAGLDVETSGNSSFSTNVGIGTANTSSLIVVGGACASAAQGKDTCWGTNGAGSTCVGYCTSGTFPACSACTCC